MAKLGYYSGDPEKVANASVCSIMDILGYEKFETEYQETMRCLNESKNR